MSASHKQRLVYFETGKKKNRLDQLLDFGEDQPLKKANDLQRLRKVIDKIDELSKRIDRLNRQ